MTSSVVASVLRHNPTSATEQARSVVADAGDVFIAGYDNLGEAARWRVERRDGRTGTLVPAFGEGGVVSVDTGPWHDDCELVLADEDHLYLSGCHRLRGSGLPDWRIEKRTKATGALVVEFGTDGQVFCDHRYWHPDENLDLAMDQDFLYLLREDFGIRHSSWRVEKRSKVTGGVTK